MTTAGSAAEPFRTSEWPGGVVPNVTDYRAYRDHFSWDDARAGLDGLPGGGLNMGHETVDRHADGSGRVALRCLGRDGSRSEVTYDALRLETNRFANALVGLGVEPGDRVFSLTGRIPELYVVALGTLKALGVFSPLFSSFGPDPVRERIARGDGRVLVTTPTLYRRKVLPIRDQLPGLEHVVLVGDGGTEIAGTIDLVDLLAGRSSEFGIPPTAPETPALLHFTSGTTGTPKGAVHVHGAILTHHETARTALDLHPDDVFWCTADPGWVTGTSYGILAPLSLGLTSVVDDRDFDAGRWYQVLEDEEVTVWYTAPTAIRMLRRAGASALEGHDLSRLRFVASVGEPLDAASVRWGQDVLGLPIHDGWWQTETGGIMIANLAGAEVRPGSMGRPLGGVEAAVVERRSTEGGARHEPVVPIDDPDVEGELALRAGWPSMFRGYLHDDERYRRCFADGWYLTGDLVHRDADGWFWFDGRADDVIKSAGHLIGPFEVERVLLDHPAVAEVGVVGVPDEVAGEAVAAFVSLADGYDPSEDLRLELVGLARRRLGPAVAPRAIVFDQDLPHTTSGKVVRRLLEDRWPPAHGTGVPMGPHR